MADQAGATKRIRLHPSGQEVAWGEGETALSALEKAGYALPNNCRAGACGECKLHVLEGRFDQGFVLDMALSPAERALGYGLMCMAKPLSELLVIDWATPDARPKLFPPREDMPFVVTDKLGRTPRIVELQLHPLGEPMRFWPGQYVSLADAAGAVPKRSYSIACAPRHDGGIALLVTRMAGGENSGWVHGPLRVGETVRLCGPYGSFVGDPAAATPVLCMSAGSGLAPLLSLAEAALRRGYRQPVTLMFSAPGREDLLAEGTLAYWQARYRNFRYLPTLTRERAAGFAHGRIPGLLPELFGDLSGFSIFAAGSPAFVADCLAAARRLGARDPLIHGEGFFDQRAEAGGGFR